MSYTPRFGSDSSQYGGSSVYPFIPNCRRHESPPLFSPAIADGPARLRTGSDTGTRARESVNPKWPVHFAMPTDIRRSVAIPIATRSWFGSFVACRTPSQERQIQRAFSRTNRNALQAAQALGGTHLQARINRQMRGTAFAHLAQSMHLSGSRLIHNGLNRKARPISAPYGQR